MTDMRRLLSLLETHETRLDELVGIKGVTNMDAFKKRLKRLPKRWTDAQTYTLANFVEDIEHLGFKRLGAGSFGIVFTHPGLDYCIKLYRTDDAYTHFVKYCFDHQDNPHLPKFRGRIVKIDKNTFFVRMENLKPLSTLSRKIVDAADAYIERFDENGVFDDLDFVKDYLKSEYAADYQSIVPHFEKNIGLLHTLVDLGKMKGEYLFDLSTENLMERNGTIVITDPFYAKDFWR